MLERTNTVLSPDIVDSVEFIYGGMHQCKGLQSRIMQTTGSD